MAKVLGQNGRTIYWDEDPESAQGDIFRGLNQQITGVRADQREQEKRKESIEDAVALIKAKMPLQREATQQTQRDKVTEAIRLLKAKQRYPSPNVPTTSISITEQPYSERLKAREITARSPEEWGKVGMAKKKGGFLGIGSKWEVGPEAVAAQEEARQVLGRKNRVTKRITSKGGFGQNVIDTTAEDLGEEKTAEDRFNELLAQGMTEDEAYEQLAQEGYAE